MKERLSFERRDEGKWKDKSYWFDDAVVALKSLKGQMR